MGTFAVTSLDREVEVILTDNQNNQTIRLILFPKEAVSFAKRLIECLPNDERDESVAKMVSDRFAPKQLVLKLKRLILWEFFNLFVSCMLLGMGVTYLYVGKLEEGMLTLIFAKLFWLDKFGVYKGIYEVKQ